MNKNSDFEIKEMINTLRTNLYFLESKKKRTVIFTSTVEKEGKSFIAANYAVSAATSGEKVLLVDCDIRKPKAHTNFELEVSQGLSDVLLGREILSNVIIKNVRVNLDLLPSKHLDANVSELFLGQPIKNIFRNLKRKYDLIILDTPPLLAAADAALLSKYSDGIVYVCGYGMVEKKELIQAKRILERAKANLYGIVVNKIDEEGYSVGNYGYYNYSYKYSEETS